GARSRKRLARRGRRRPCPRTRLCASPHIPLVRPAEKSSFSPGSSSYYSGSFLIASAILEGLGLNRSSCGVLNCYSGLSGAASLTLVTPRLSEAHAAP